MPQDDKSKDYKPQDEIPQDDMPQDNMPPEKTCPTDNIPQNTKCPISRGEPKRGYKEPNPNQNILSLVFVSYNQIRIVQPDTNIGFLYSF